MLTNLNKKINDGKDDILSFCKKHISDIVEYISEKYESNQSKKKTILSALFILTGLQPYHTAMIDFAGKVNDFYRSQKINDTREEQKKITLEEIQSKYDEYKNVLKKNPTIENYINYFVVAFTSCKILNPRRNLDWISIKIRNVNKDYDNYIDSKGFIIFNKFKTAKYHEKGSLERRIECPKELLTIIKKFAKVSENDYLLYHEKAGSPYSSSYFSKNYKPFMVRVSLQM